MYIKYNTLFHLIIIIRTRGLKLFAQTVHNTHKKRRQENATQNPNNKILQKDVYLFGSLHIYSYLCSRICINIPT